MGIAAINFELFRDVRVSTLAGKEALMARQEVELRWSDEDTATAV